MDAEGTDEPPGIHRGSLLRFMRRAQAAVALEGDVTTLLTNDARIQVLNRNFRKKNKATDVLSFPADSHAVGVAGDIAISLDTAARQAEEHGHPLQTEVRVLLLHGLLHLAGYDHELDAGEMATKEAAMRRRFRLPVGLIERAGTEAMSAHVVPVKRRAVATKKGCRA